MWPLLLLLPLLVAEGCGGNTSLGVTSLDGPVPETDTGAHDTNLPLGAPITASPGVWTWIDFPDSACDDGTPTGIGVYPSTKSDKLIVYFNGGGACWDYMTCAVLHTSTQGPFGSSQFAMASRTGFPNSILDHSAIGNPFEDYSAVYVPYCTGDLHAGDAVTTYTAGAARKTVQHRGHANVLAYLARIAATFKTPGQIAVTGSSAGGAGAVFNYPSLRAYWPTLPMLLIDDSLPFFEGDSIAPDLRTAWFEGWNLGKLTDPLCGMACRGDLSLVMKAVAAKYPGDRMALLSSQQDFVVRLYYRLDAMEYQTALSALTTDVLDPSGFRHFYIAGKSHTMLFSVGGYTSKGTPLSTWLTQMATGDTAWMSVGP